MIYGVRRNQMAAASPSEAEWEIPYGDSFFSAAANGVPLPSAVQGPRTFYGSRFFEQTLPLVGAEAPLVKNMHEESGRSWDTFLGHHMGAIFADDADDGAEVLKATPDSVLLRRADGTKREVELFNNFPGNRKTLLTSRLKVAPGDRLKAGQLIAPSNFTDDEGRMAIGRNARVAVVPFKGATMDDAVVVSAAFARNLLSDHAETVDVEPDENLKAGKAHYVALFHKKFNAEQLDKIDDNGMVKPGAVLQPGDPIALQTMPRTYNSNRADVGRLSRSQRFVRRDAAMLWDGEYPAEVIDVAKTKEGGMKFLMRYQAPAKEGDKIVFRSGQKGTISMVIPDEKMPRTEDNQPLDILFNPLGLPSRVNASTFYELLLGKVAKKTGKPYTLPAFPPKGSSWLDIVKREMAKHQVQGKERVFDPEENRFLDNPVTVGWGHVLKLHHQAGKKMVVRGQRAYTADMQPMKGSGQGAQRLSSLEMNVLHSSGARGVQREALLLRGEKRDEYWKQLRANRTPAQLDKPFVWHKFRALLEGSGINTKDLGDGRIRLTPMTDKEIDAREPLEIENDGIVDLKDYTPKPGGLFDPRLVREGKWGFVRLREPVINPAYEDTVRILLGLTKKEYEELLEK
jgi:DNA-directed RNA polymerase subunit beta